MKKRNLALLLALVLVVGAVAGTIAYLNSTTEEVVNTFTVGKVKIVLDEDEVQKDEKTGAFAKTGSETRVLENKYELVMPGDNLPKDPTVTVLKDSADCYVRATLTLSLTKDGVDAALKAQQAGEGAAVKAIIADMVKNLDKYLVGFNEKTWRPYGVGTYEALTIDDATALSMVQDLLDKNEVKVELWYKEVVPAVTEGKAGKNTKDGDYEGKSLEPIFTAINVPGDLNENTLPIFDGMQIKVVANAIQAKNLATDVAAWKAFDGVTEETTTTGE